jgi:hypothetical protein
LLLPGIEHRPSSPSPYRQSYPGFELNVLPYKMERFKQLKKAIMREERIFVTGLCGKCMAMFFYPKHIFLTDEAFFGPFLRALQKTKDRYFMEDGAEAHC